MQKLPTFLQTYADLSEQSSLCATYFQLIKDGNLHKLRQFLKCNPDFDLDSQDDAGLTLKNYTQNNPNIKIKKMRKKLRKHRSKKIMLNAQMIRQSTSYSSTNSQNPNNNISDAKLHSTKNDIDFELDSIDSVENDAVSIAVVADDADDDDESEQKQQSDSEEKRVEEEEESNPSNIQTPPIIHGDRKNTLMKQNQTNPLSTDDILNDTSFGYASFNSGLHYAVEKNHQKIIRFLHAMGANIENVNKKGSTPLHLACCFGCYDIVCVLVGEFRANLLAENNIGNTPLHCAIYQRRLGIAEFLLDHHEYPVYELNFHKNRAGMTPAMYAGNSMEIREFIQRMNQKYNPDENDDGNDNDGD